MRNERVSVSGSKMGVSTLHEGIVIRYSNSGVRESRSVVAAIESATSNRTMIVNVGGRTFKVLPDSTTHTSYDATASVPNFFPAKMRERIAKRDLGHCRVCGQISVTLCILYLGDEYSSADQLTDTICLVCSDCAISLSCGKVAVVKLGVIRDSEYRYRIREGIPLSLNASTVMQTVTGNHGQPGASKIKRFSSKMTETQKEHSDRGRRDSSVSICEPLIATTLDGRTITVLAPYSERQLAIVLREREPITSGLRYKVVRRDKGICRFCLEDKGEFVIEHVVPITDGGATTISNLALACTGCNEGKVSARDQNVLETLPLSMINETVLMLTGHSSRRPPARTRKS